MKRTGLKHLAEPLAESAKRPRPVKRRRLKGRGGGDQPHTPIEDPNTLKSRATANVVELLSEGEIEGPLNGSWEKSIYFDGTVLQNASGTLNVSNITVDARVGTPTQTPLAGFPNIEATEFVGTTVTHASPVVYTVTDLDADAARVTIRIPALYQANNQGDVLKTTLNLKIEVKSFAGSYVTRFEEGIYGKNSAPYEKDYLIDGLPALGDGPWSIRVTRVSNDFDSVTLVGDLIFQYATTIINHRLMYPNSAVVGLRIDASAFGGGQPKRTFAIKGIKMQVPTNYDPVARTYTGTWDGTFKTAYARNPAWVFYATATNPRWGAGEFLNELGMDKWGLYTIGQYCDQMISDGEGGLMPRYECNGVINTRAEAFRVLAALVSIFRGMVYFINGQITATADMPMPVDLLVNNADVIDGAFRYQGQGVDAQHSVARVTWNNPDLGYGPDIQVVEDRVALRQIGYVETEFLAPLCTRRGQAHLAGKWLLYTERTQGDSVQYRAGWDHARKAFPGRHIKVADKNIAGFRLGGRLKSGSTTTSIKLDAPFEFEYATVYTLEIHMPDGTIEARTTVPFAGATDTVAVASAFSTAPAVNAVWVLTSTIAPREFVILSVFEPEEGIYEINALLHDPTKYDAVENDLFVDSAVFTGLKTGQLDHPTNFGSHQYLYEAGAGAVFGAVLVGWTHTRDPRVRRYECEQMRNGTSFSRVGTFVTDNSIVLEDFSRDETTFQFRVRAVDDLGNHSEWLESGPIAVSMFRAAPGNITNFAGQSVGEQALFRWDPDTSLGLSHYVMRFSPVTSGAIWGTASIALTNIVGTSASVPAQRGTYLIKAVSLAGVESVTETAFVLDVPDLVPPNAVETITGEPSWTGTKTHVTVSGSNLELDDGQDTGEIVFPTVDLGDVYTSRVSSLLTAFGSNAAFVMSSWPALSSVERLSGSDPSSWSIRAFERHTDDDPAGSPTWSDWAEVAVGSIKARAFQAKLVFTRLSPSVTPTATAFAFTIDMPDRHIIGKGIQSTTSGVSVTFPDAFKALKTVLITVTDLQTGEYWKVPTQSETGFHVDVYNASNAKIDRKVNYDAIGYGLAS